MAMGACWSPDGFVWVPTMAESISVSFSLMSVALRAGMVEIISATAGGRSQACLCTSKESSRDKVVYPPEDAPSLASSIALNVWNAFGQDRDSH